MQDRVVEFARELQRPESRRPARSCRRRSAGGGVVRRRAIVIVAMRSARSMSTLDQADSRTPSVAERARRAASARCPCRRRCASRLRGELAARARRPRPRTCEFGTTSSTSRHSTARLPLTPSSMVQNTSAWSRRTLRLSATRVRPPVPGSTASSGTSGSDTDGRAVVGQDDVVGGERQLIAAAGRGAVDGADDSAGRNSRSASSMPLRVSLVNLQKLTLWAWRRAGQHADIGAGAEHRGSCPSAAPPPCTSRMLEAQPLHGVGELDIDAEIVGIQLELIAFEQAAVLVDVHGQRRDLAVDVELPMPVARRIGLEIDPRSAVRPAARSATGSMRSARSRICPGCHRYEL